MLASSRSGAHRCDICERRKPLSFHHLIPKKNHRRKAFQRRYSKTEMQQRGLWLCQPCHRKLHQTYSEKELGERLNSLAAILAEPELQGFIHWIKKQH